MGYYLLILIWAEDEHKFSPFEARQAAELRKDVIQDGFAGQMDERLRPAPGVGAHACSQPRHRYNNFPGFFQETPPFVKVYIDCTLSHQLFK